MDKGIVGLGVVGGFWLLYVLLWMLLMA